MDGNLVAQKSTTVTPRLQLDPRQLPGIGIGNDPSAYDFPWFGDIEEVVLYSRALSAAEVASLAAGPCTPRQGTATAQLVNGVVVGATITDGGCGYTNTAAVLIEGGGGSGATAAAVVTNGVVTGITITDAGVGYTSTPTVYIYPPPRPPDRLGKGRQTLFRGFIAWDELPVAGVGRHAELDESRLAVCCY
jgi:hypothetical protein